MHIYVHIAERTFPRDAAWDAAAISAGGRSHGRTVPELRKKRGGDYCYICPERSVFVIEEDVCPVAAAAAAAGGNSHGRTVPASRKWGGGAYV